MNWKWKQQWKWLLSLAAAFSMVFSTIGTAAVTRLADPAITADTRSETILDIEEKTAPGTGEGADPDSGGATIPSAVEEADPDSNEAMIPDTGEESDSDFSGIALPDTGEATAPDSGEGMLPDSSEEPDSDFDEAAVPDAIEKADPDSDESMEPDTGEEADPDSNRETDSDFSEESDSKTGEGAGGGDLPAESRVDLENPPRKPSVVLVPDIHEHQWFVDWSYDKSYHWHECDGEDCPVTDDSEKDGYAEHSFGDDNICTRCGYFGAVNELARVAAGAVPTYEEAYEAMIALKEQYAEGMTWTNFTPYGSEGSLGASYVWKGGKIYGSNQGVGCSAFAFILSDEAFESLPARPIKRGSFTFDDVKVGDILRVKNNSHSVIVLQKSAGGVIVAEGNYNKSVHWGRAMSKSEVLATDFIITRYPEGYEPPDDPDDEEPVQGGQAGRLNWFLTGSGVLTISGNGTIPNYSDSNSAPWNQYSVNTVILEDGVTGIGNYAFYGSRALSIYIPDSVERIGENAFNGSALISVTIPGSVGNIGSNAFRGCANLTSVTVCEGVETIGDEAFRGCTSLTYIDFPASITSVGTGAFMSCGEMTQVRFMPGSGAVTLGDNLFSQCWHLTSVTLPQTADRITAGMFASCTELPTLHIPASVTEIGENPFTSCKQLKYIYFSGSEADWKRITNPYLESSLKSTGTTMIFNAPFDDPFAANPDDPGDFQPGEDVGGTDPGDSSHRHTWFQSWNCDGIGHWHECGVGCTVTDNQNKDGYGRHSYGGWVIDANATAFQDGSRHRDCMVCSYRQIERIPAEGSYGGGYGSSDDGSGSSSDSSDTYGGSSEFDTAISTIVRRFSDGLSITTIRQKNGTVATVTTDSAGRAKIKVQLSARAVRTAKECGKAVSLPVFAVEAVRDVAAASAITVHTGNEPVKVAIPVVQPTEATVVAIIREDGFVEIISSSVTANGTVVVSLSNGATVKIMDNSKSFSDVPAESQFADGIGFVSARDLFYNPSETSFNPGGAMTWAMVMTALARFDGVETAGGTTWYAKSMEWASARGINNGAGPDSTILCGELITTVWRYMGSPIAADSPSGYAEAGPISDEQAAMNWAVKNGVANGFENGIPGSQVQITRGQAAQIIMNLVNRP